MLKNCYIYGSVPPSNKDDQNGIGCLPARRRHYRDSIEREVPDMDRLGLTNAPFKHLQRNVTECINLLLLSLTVIAAVFSCAKIQTLQRCSSGRSY